MSSYAALDGILYCKHHFSQLFKEKGSYNHLLRMNSLKKKEDKESTPVEEEMKEEEVKEEEEEEESS